LVASLNCRIASNLAKRQSGNRGFAVFSEKVVDRFGQLGNRFEFLPKPLIELGDFFSGFPAGLIFVGGFANCERMSEGSSLLQGYGSHFQAMHSNGGACVG
jgi:hypothetical protein